MNAAFLVGELVSLSQSRAAMLDDFDRNASLHATTIANAYLAWSNRYGGDTAQSDQLPLLKADDVSEFLRAIVNPTRFRVRAYDVEGRLIADSRWRYCHGMQTDLAPWPVPPIHSADFNELTRNVYIELRRWLDGGIPYVEPADCNERSDLPANLRGLLDGIPSLSAIGVSRQGDELITAGNPIVKAHVIVGAFVLIQGIGQSAALQVNESTFIATSGMLLAVLLSAFIVIMNSRD
jgi:hypothetical protein